MKTLLTHAFEIQRILLTKSNKVELEIVHSPMIGERESIKVRTPDSLCYITTEPIINYCKKNKIELRIRGAVSETNQPLTEIYLY